MTIFKRSTIYTLFSNKQIFGYDNGRADVTKCSSKFFCNTRRPNVKTWRLAEHNFLNFLGKNLTIGAPIKIYRRRRRVEFIGGGGVSAAAPTSDRNHRTELHGKKILITMGLFWLEARFAFCD